MVGQVAAAVVAAVAAVIAGAGAGAELAGGAAGFAAGPGRSGLIGISFPGALSSRNCSRLLGGGGNWPGYGFHHTHCMKEQLRSG